MDALKLVALEQDDLEVVSTHLQDAILKIGDILWQPRERRLVLALCRFDWLAAVGAQPELRRRLCALRFDRVTALKCRNIHQANKDAVLNLLAVAFEEGDPPAGAVTLTFSGGAALRLEVECLEAELADLGPAWAAQARPAHADEASQARG
jgi:hypothetical protein